MKLRIAAPILLLCLLGTAWVEGCAPPHAPRIEEDEPGWDCRTMGNRYCGPNAVYVTPTGVYTPPTQEDNR